jgi:hypothetical protein
MYSRPTAPLTIGSVIDDAIKIYLASFRRIWPIALWASLIAGAFGLVLGLYLLNTLHAISGPAVLRAYMNPTVSLLYLVQIVLTIAFYGALIAAQDAATGGNPPLTNGEAIALGFHRLGRAVGAGLLLWIVIAVGLVLLVIPGIYFMLALCLSPVAMFVDDAGAVQSLEISRSLVKGHWWRTFTIFSVALVVMMVLAMVIGVVIGGFAFIWRRDPVGTQIASQLVGIVANVFILPMMPAILIAIYRDLKLRREGGDLAARVGALAKG